MSENSGTWEQRAKELVHHSVLATMPQSARVWALHEYGYNQVETANELNLDQSTVSRHLSRAKKEIARARWTVENVEEADGTPE